MFTPAVRCIKGLAPEASYVGSNWSEQRRVRLVYQNVYTACSLKLRIPDKPTFSRKSSGLVVVERTRFWARDQSSYLRWLTPYKIGTFLVKYSLSSDALIFRQLGHTYSRII